MTKRDPTKVWSFNYRLPASVLASVAPQSAVLGLEVKDLFLRLVDPSGSRLVQATLWAIGHLGRGSTAPATGTVPVTALVKTQW